MPQPKRKQDDGPTIKVKGREYNVNKDFTWRELMTVEELSGFPLGRPDSFESTAVAAAIIFVVLKRDEKELTWEAFLDGSIEDLEADEPATNGDGPKRPTRAAKAASAPVD